MSQLNYNLNPAQAVAGMLAEMNDTVIASKIAQAATTVGLLCSMGTTAQVGPGANTVLPTSTTPGTVIPFAATATDPIDQTLYVGVPLYDSARSPYNSSNQYAIGDSVPVLMKGRVWVLVPDATVTQYGAVFIKRDNNTTYPLGTFLAGANAGAGIKLHNARYLTTSPSGGGLVIVEIW